MHLLQVIRLLEQFSLPDLVISLANTALSVADDDDPNIVSWLSAFVSCHFTENFGELLQLYTYYHLSFQQNSSAFVPQPPSWGYNCDYTSNILHLLIWKLQRTMQFFSRTLMCS